MKIRKVLLPTDFSHLSDAGLPLAASLARDSGAELIILHVQEPPLAYAAGEWYYGPPQPDADALRRLLENIKPPYSSIPCIHQLVTGDPAQEIVRVADSEGADMIVMGTHGRRGLARTLMGSVTEQVIRRAKCPVLIFKVPLSGKKPKPDVQSAAKRSHATTA